MIYLNTYLFDLFFPWSLFYLECRWYMVAPDYILLSIECHRWHPGYCKNESLNIMFVYRLESCPLARWPDASWATPAVRSWSITTSPGYSLSRGSPSAAKSASRGNFSGGGQRSCTLAIPAGTGSCCATWHLSISTSWHLLRPYSNLLVSVWLSYITWHLLVCLLADSLTVVLAGSWTMDSCVSCNQ